MINLFTLVVRLTSWSLKNNVKLLTSKHSYLAPPEAIMLASHNCQLTRTYLL